ncbi:DUF4307 domain-containing protein [Leucobacter viscericola]|uniref:DUF4307 domain-containing protein n=1 Tax=Leucobacter viscericola TaxID=2714935 RepID=A0A6G7XHJ6_9MICO|nr:DUF4307 domain-containing protein [Leucobacter viscericola]QIK64023.1 DUF4307 domain-containing protein [Leucobacter viscericola]
MSQAASPAAPPLDTDATAADASVSASGATTQTLEDRYGRGKKRRVDRRFAWIAGVTLVVGGLAFLVFSGWESSNQVQAQDIVFKKTGEFSGTMKFEVTAPPNTPVACVVEALNTSKAPVGWSVVELPVSEKRITTVNAPVRTVGPATAAYAKECWVVERSK